MVIGAGVIGLELGSVWRRLGAEVTVIEFLDRIVPTMDAEVATAFQRILTKQGLKFRLGSKVTGAVKGNAGVTLTVEPAKGGPAETLNADIVLLAIGRRAYTEGLGLAEVGVGEARQRRGGERRAERHGEGRADTDQEQALRQREAGAQGGGRGRRGGGADRRAGRACEL